MKYAFFGTSNFSVIILEELVKAEFKPDLIVTETDKPKGRGLKTETPPVKIWAEAHSIPVLQPPKLDSDFIDSLSTLNPLPFTLFLVASYGKIIPSEILAIPEKGALNVHPSLLPKYRGPSPIQTAIMEGETENGVTIMLMDEKMDHGPIIASRKINTFPDKNNSTETEKLTAHSGGELLTETIPLWLKGEIKAIPQDDSKATYSKKLSKKDGLINISDNPVKNYRKYLALKNSVGIRFLTNTKNSKIHVKIVDARMLNDRFSIETVIPESRNPMPYQDFLRGFSVGEQ